MGSGVILPSPGQPTVGPDKGFVSGSVPNFTTFAFKQIGPPSTLYVQRDDVLLIRCSNNIPGSTFSVQGRLLIPYQPASGQPTKSGESPADTPPISGGTIIRISQVFAPVALPAGNNFQVQLSEGYLLSVIVGAIGGNPQPGQIYVEVLLFQGPSATGNNGQLLCCGYLTAVRHIGWPGGPTDAAQAGPGFTHSVQQANPAAGADFIYTVASGLRQRIQSFSALLTASAAPANRNVTVTVDDGANIVWQSSLAASITAAQAARVSGTGTNAPTGVNTLAVSLVLPPGLVLLAGHRILSTTAGIQAGDQWSAIWFLVEEWISD